MADDDGAVPGGGTAWTDEERGLLAAAATGAVLGTEERAALFDLLSRDPEARRELDDLRAVLAELEPLRAPGAGWREEPARPLVLPAPAATPLAGPEVPGVSGVSEAPGLTEVPVALPSPRQPHRQPHRRRTAAFALAACGLLVAGGLAGAAVRGAVDDRREAAAVVAGPPGTLGAVEALTVQTASTSVTATASVVAHTWGTEAFLDATGLPAGEVYRVVVVDEQGRAVSAGTFLGAEQPVDCVMNAAVLRQDVDRLEVLDPAGTAVIISDLPTV